MTSRRNHLVLLAAAVWGCGDANHLHVVPDMGPTVMPQVGATRHEHPAPDAGPTPCVPPANFCYQGPPGTAGVGVCQPGVWTCSEAGALVCAGQQGPLPELCNNLDDDCDGEVDENFDLGGCRDVLWLVDVSCSMSDERDDVNAAVRGWEEVSMGSDDRTWRVELPQPEHAWDWVVDEVPPRAWRPGCRHWAVLFIDEPQSTQASQTHTATAAWDVLATHEVRFLSYSLNPDEYAVLGAAGDLRRMTLAADLTASCME